MYYAMRASAPSVAYCLLSSPLSVHLALVLCYLHTLRCDMLFAMAHT